MRRAAFEAAQSLCAAHRSQHNQGAMWLRKAARAVRDGDYELALVSLANASMFLEMAHPAQAKAARESMRPKCG